MENLPQPGITAQRCLQAAGCTSSFRTEQQPALSAAGGGHQGQLCWTPTASMIFLPHKKIVIKKKNPTLALEK